MDRTLSNDADTERAPREWKCWRPPDRILDADRTTMAILLTGVGTGCSASRSPNRLRARLHRMRASVRRWQRAGYASPWHRFTAAGNLLRRPSTATATAGPSCTKPASYVEYCRSGALRVPDADPRCVRVVHRWVQ